MHETSGCRGAVVRRSRVWGSRRDGGLGPGIQVQEGDEEQAFFRFEGRQAVHAGGPFALVILRDAADGQAFGRPGTQEQTLQAVNGPSVTPLGSSVDPPLELVDLPLDRGPRDVPPFLHSRCRCAHDAVPRRPLYYLFPCGPVGLSPGFPGGVGFWANPSPSALRPTGCSLVERRWGVLRSR